MTNVTPRAGCVVVLDDHEQVRQMLCVALQVVGFETLEATTPTQAYRHLASTQPPQALVISLQDAADEGLAVLRYVRAHADLAAMPIIFLAAQSTEELRWQALRAGADWFSRKPLSLRDLQQRVGDLVRRGRPRARLRYADGSPPQSRRLAG